MTIDELGICISRLLALAKARGITEVHPGERDSYWVVSGPEWVDMTKQPQQLGVGSMDDDLSELKKLLTDPHRASSVDFDRAATLLRLISDELSGSASD